MMGKTGSLISSSRTCGQRAHIRQRRQSTKYTATVLSIGLLLVCPGGTSTPPEAIDPLFGVHFDSSSVKFQPLPVEWFNACASLRNEAWDRKMWIFAQSRESEPRYAVIGGYLVKRSGSSIETDKVGAVIRILNGRCDLMGAARDVFDYPPHEIATSKLHELATDAVCRYSQAFGDYRKFIGEMRRQRIATSTIRSAVLRNAILSPPNGCR